MNDYYSIQSKWLLENKDKLKNDPLSCPPFKSREKTGCQCCVVSNFSSGSGCDFDRKIKASKNYLRILKLKRIIEDEDI